MNPALSMNSVSSSRKGGVKTIFVAGTDTGVGKTIVSGLLARYLLKKGYRTAMQKWVKTGCRSLTKTKDAFLPYKFKFPASPHLAAGLERRRINADKIIKSTKTLSRRFDFVIVEGIGGLMVPLNEKMLLIDMVEVLKIPVLLVAANKLGAINHTLLSIEALKARKINLIGVIFNNLFRKENSLILKDNPEIIKKFSGIRTLGILPYAKNILTLQNRFAKIGEKIVAHL